MSFRIFFLPALALLAAGCARKAPERAFDRVAVLPFDNLTAQQNLDWIGPLVPAVLVAQTAESSRLFASGAGGDFDLARLRATLVLRGYYQLEGSRLRIRAALSDIARNAVIRRFDHSGPAADGPLPLLESLSRSLAGKARPFPHADPAALVTYGEALLAIDAPKRAELAEAAWKKDPVLAGAALEAAQARLAMGDAAGGMKILQAVASKDDTAETAQAKLMMALIERNPATLRLALEKAIRYSPNNGDLIGELGQMATRSRDYAAAEQWFRKALALEPNFASVWNMLSYTQAYAGEFQPALLSAARLRELTPNDPNSFDSIGEINWMSGRFDQAYKSFLDAQQKDPLFQGGLEFSKAAFTRLMAGDITNADQLFNRYLESRRAAADPIADLRHAHWFYLSGRKAQGYEAAAKIVQAGGELGSRAASFQAVWLLQDNRRAEAQTMAYTAKSLARSPGAVNMAAIAALLASPSTPPEQWQARARTLFSPQAPAGFLEGALAYALLLDGHAAASAQLLDRLVKQSSPGAVDEPQALLAGALLQTGDAKRAMDLLVRWPLPPVPGESLFASLWFPQVIEWRGKAVEKIRGPAAAAPLFLLYNAIVGR